MKRPTKASLALPPAAAFVVVRPSHSCRGREGGRICKLLLPPPPDPGAYIACGGGGGDCVTAGEQVLPLKQPHSRVLRAAWRAALVRLATMTTAERRPENAKDNKCNKDNRRTDGRTDGRKEEGAEREVEGGEGR